MNALKNAILPVDVRKMESTLGFAEKVFVEVAVSKILRKILRMDNKGILHLAAIHYASMPLMGGLMAPFGAPNKITKAATYGEAFTDGIKGVPAVYLAQYIVNTGVSGLHTPKFSISDAGITAVAKAITRPLMKFLTQYLGTDIDQHFQTAEALIRRQVQVSNLKFG